MTLVGDVLPDFGFTVTSNTTGVPTSPASFVVTLTAPDGSTSTVAMTEASPGVFAPTTPPPATLVGQYIAAGVATGNGCDGAQVITWQVEAGAGVVDVRDALAHLRAKNLITDADDVEHLRWLCLVATDAVAGDLGRALLRTAVTEKHTGGLCSLRLRRTPVVSVTTVVENGVTLTGGEDVDWYLDDLPRTGLLHRGSPLAPRRWACGRIVVTYVAHLTPCPPVVRSVVLGVVEQLWQSGAQVPRSSFDQTVTDAALYTTTGQLTPPERAAYEALRATSGLGIA